MDTLYDLFEHELKDLYDAEQKLADALGRQAGECVDDEVAAAFEEHQAQTEEQVERLEKVFELLGIEPEAETCHGIDGLLKEHEAFAEEEPAPEILQVFNLAAAAKVERYEITAYESAIRLAEQLGVDQDVIELLEETLEEEQETLELVTELAEETEPAQVEAITR